MEQGSSSSASDEATFLNDIAELRPQALRERYKGEASSHAAMKRRCKNGDFDLDPLWNEFRSFLRDMGPRPSPSASIDRIDGANPRYGPGLCRWATKAEQTSNRRNTIWIDFQGERIGLREFSKRLGAPYSTVHSRIAQGDSPEAVARRYAAGQISDQCYRPAWITDEVALQRWRAEYNRWVKRVRRDRRASAPPEVYAVILASEALNEATRKLDRIMEEVAPTDLPEVEAKYARDLRIRANAIDWIKDALRSLAQRERSLAARLVPRHGEWRDLWRFERWLMPDDED